MNLPISWLKQFVNIKADAQEIAQKLTLSGSEVERITDNSQGLRRIIVGKIIQIESHPDADNLCVAIVDVGREKGVLKIVCGAKNIKEGNKVPCVLVGGSVLGLEKVERRKVRGVSSQGMLCSEKELGIGDNHTGIYILPEDAKVGTDVVNYLELDEKVLELDITPNRPDCFSVRGLAREVGALFGKKLNEAPLRQGYGGRASSNLRESGTSASSAVSVRIEDKRLCTKYCGRVIQGVNVGTSPLWLQNKLRQVDIRPINNVVDVTNYVMMELGHPLHAFDANLLNGDTIIIRKAKENEKILALDEEKYSLDSGMLVVADNKKPIAIAGIMGGQESSVHQGTHNIILEAAVFDQTSIRKTSKQLNLRSESSSRFEKGIDLEVVEEAIDRAAAMIQDLAGGTVLRGIVQAGSDVKQTAKLGLAVSEVERILGVGVSSAKVKSILSSLGFPARGWSASGREVLKVQVPSFRVHDIKIAEDLIEEIGRILDYNTMPKTLPTSELISPRMEPLHKLRRDLRHHLTGTGYSEILTYSFYNEALLDLSGHSKSNHIMLTNPVNDEYPYLRASLAPWMLDKLSQNSSILAREEFQLFEIGKVFNKKEEKWQACVGLINTQSQDEELYRRLRGVLESFIGSPLSVEPTYAKASAGKKYCLVSGKREIATIRVYPKHTISALRFRSSAAIMLIDLEMLVKLQKEEKGTFVPIPYYPVIQRDLGVIVPNMVQYKDIEGAISKFNPLIKNVQLFDVYHGLGKGQSLALRITFSSDDRTLESKEVDEIMDKLRASLEKKFKVTFR